MASILVVEDEMILGDLMRQQLEAAGHQVRWAVNGKQAWQLIEEAAPDIVLSDLLMPEMNGYELLEKLHADDRFTRIPVLVLSNSGQNDDLNRAFDLGARDVLIKANFNPDQLVDTVARLLNAPAPTPAT